MNVTQRTDTTMQPIPVVPLKVLVVDDYTVSRRLMDMLLGDLGHKTMLVRSGHEAVNAVQRQDFDYIFLDLQMPEMDGHQAAHAIRALPGGMRPVLVACSADDNEELRQRCLNDGFSYVLPKPVSMDALTEILSGRVEKKDSQAAESIAAHWTIPDGLQGLAAMAGRDKVADLLNLYLRETEKRIDTLIKTLQSHDIETFTRTAHSMKGSSAQMGAPRMTEISAQLEQQGKAGGRIELKTLVELSNELGIVVGCINRYLQGQ